MRGQGKTDYILEAICIAILSRRRGSPGTISVKFYLDVNRWPTYQTAQKHCRKCQSLEQGARTLQTDDRRTDDSIKMQPRIAQRRRTVDARRRKNNINGSKSASSNVTASNYLPSPLQHSHSTQTNGSRVHCAFLDATQAFDKVLFNGLYLKLIEKDATLSFIRILVTLYIEQQCAVVWNSCVGYRFDVKCGVRQGGVLSLYLFSVYVDDPINELKTLRPRYTRRHGFYELHLICGRYCFAFCQLLWPVKND